MTLMCPYYRLFVLLLALVGTIPSTAQAQDPGYEPMLNVRLLIAYTPAAMDSLGGEAAITNAIMGAVDEMNLAYFNSEVEHWVQLVRTCAVGAQESDCFVQDVVAFSRMQEVDSLRTKYRADVAVLILDNPEFCGLPLIMDAVATASTAYCAVHWKCLMRNLSLPHQIAHLYGCSHSTQKVAAAGDGAPYAYGHGYEWSYLDTDIGFATILGIDDQTNCAEEASDYQCYLIPYFSNPSVQYSGVPTGIAGLADNVRVLNMNGPLLANFYPLQPIQAVSDTVVAHDFAYLQALDTVRNEGNYYVGDTAMVWFQASDRVILDTGFTVMEGAYFETLLDSLAQGNGSGSVSDF
jgi:hypothetical protein